MASYGTSTTGHVDLTKTPRCDLDFHKMLPSTSCLDPNNWACHAQHRKVAPWKPEALSPSATKVSHAHTKADDDVGDWLSEALVWKPVWNRLSVWRRFWLIKGHEGYTHSDTGCHRFCLNIDGPHMGQKKDIAWSNASRLPFHQLSWAPQRSPGAILHQSLPRRAKSQAPSARPDLPTSEGTHQRCPGMDTDTYFLQGLHVLHIAHVIHNSTSIQLLCIYIENEQQLLRLLYVCRHTEVLMLQVPDTSKNCVLKLLLVWEVHEGILREWGWQIKGLTNSRCTIHSVSVGTQPVLPCLLLPCVSLSPRSWETIVGCLTVCSIIARIPGFKAVFENNLIVRVFVLWGI